MCAVRAVSVSCTVQQDGKVTHGDVVAEEVQVLLGMREDEC